MLRRFLFRALVPAAALALTGAIGLTPATASGSTWQINSVVGDPTGFTTLTNVAASGPDNAVAGGFACSDTFCSTETAAVERWNGHSWQAVTLPDSNLGASGYGLAVGTSSANNTWIFGSSAWPGNTGYGVHVTDSGVTETALPADGGIAFNGAAVFAPNDAWAFGITGDFFLDNFSAYAAHYDGQTWTQMPTPPVVPQSVSALSADNLWILGQASLEPGSTLTFAAARWTGSGWATVALPDAAGLKLPAGAAFNPVGIVGESANNIWVTADMDTTCPPCGLGNGVLLLHWNGSAWHSVDVPSTSVLGQFDQDVASDGAGGLWVTGYVNQPTFSGPYFYHFLNDHWTRQLAPTQGGGTPQFGSLAPVPGTTSVWGAADLFALSNNSVSTSQGIVYQLGQ